jgi:hypothetical protein
VVLRTGLEAVINIKLSMCFELYMAVTIKLAVFRNVVGSIIFKRKCPGRKSSPYSPATIATLYLRNIRIILFIKHVRKSVKSDF